MDGGLTPTRGRDRTLLALTAVGAAGLIVLLAAVAAFLWRGSVRADERRVGVLADTLGAQTAAVLNDARLLLAEFEALRTPRCSAAHLQALQAAAISRPQIRAIGYWRAAERRCGVGFLGAEGLRPPRADRIYDSGVIAWWPSAATEVGGVRLFLVRYGDHDLALDPRALLDVGPLEGRAAGLWAEGLLLTAQPESAVLPEPRSLPIGLTIDREGGRAISRYTRPGDPPIDVVAVEPLDRFWVRYRSSLLLGAGAGLAALVLWLYVMLRVMRARLSRGAQLRRAIRQGRIRASYQPIVALDSRQCIGAEVLARWTTERGEVIRPDSFVELADREGILGELTLAVLSRALRDLAPLLRERPALSVALNLGRHDLEQGAFAETLAGALQALDLPTRSIKLEVTERALLDTDLARARIAALREAGHEVAVDDFGTGYSSLSYLSSFPLDLLKVDRSFVEAIGTGAATSQVVVHIIEMARSLGLRMVAEGVETEAQAAWLRDRGVEYGQGFLFSPPLSAEEFAAFVRREPV